MNWAKASVFYYKLNNIRAQGISLNNLGNIHFKECRFDEALNCYEESISLVDQEISQFLCHKRTDDLISSQIDSNFMKDS